MIQDIKRLYYWVGLLIFCLGLPVAIIVGLLSLRTAQERNIAREALTLLSKREFDRVEGMFPDHLEMRLDNNFRELWRNADEIIYLEFTRETNVRGAWILEGYSYTPETCKIGFEVRVWRHELIGIHVDGVCTPTIDLSTDQ